MSAVEQGRVLTIDDQEEQPVVIHIHGYGAEINVNVTHYHYPEWLTKEAVAEIIREIKTV